MLFCEPLVEENFTQYCMRHYQNPQCLSIEDFQEDLKTIKYIKRLFSKYRQRKIITEKHCRLILNHIIVLYNIFGVEAATRILFFRIDKKHYSTLKTFLIYLSLMPDIVPWINGENIMAKDISVDLKVAETLGKT